MAEKLAEVKAIVRRRILSIPLVSSISYDVERRVITVTVTSEEAIERVREKVPDRLAGYEVEFEVRPKPKLFYARRAKHRPVPGGVSACTSAGTACTNASRVFDEGGSLCLLSNTHCYTPVVFTGDFGDVGQAIEQPGPADQPFGGADFKCGEQYRWQEPVEGQMYVDAALARPTVEVSDVVLGNGSPENPDEWEVTKAIKAEKGLRVKKAGRTSDVTYGTITRANIDTSAGTDGRVLWHVLDQVEIEMESIPGDSGSLIVTQEEERAVALLWGGGGGYTYASPIGFVMQDLDCGFGAPPHVPPETHPELVPPPPPGPNYKLLGGAGMVGLAAVSIFNAGATGRDPLKW